MNKIGRQREIHVHYWGQRLPDRARFDGLSAFDGEWARASVGPFWRGHDAGLASRIDARWTPIRITGAGIPAGGEWHEMTEISMVRFIGRRRRIPPTKWRASS